MDNYEFKIGVEPTNKYKKAKQDVVQALNSIKQLNENEQQVLAEELFGTVNAVMMHNILQKYFLRQAVLHNL